jgi:uncharacterized protein
MAKAPVAGRAKTRLAREIGTAPAMRFGRHSCAALLQRVSRDPRWRTTLAVTPDAAVASRIWPPRIPVIGQGNGDLGHRMQRLFQHKPGGPLVIIGTDIPGIACAHIAAAFRALGRNDVAIGPAADGGYWLIGMRRQRRAVSPFAGVRWSSAHTLDDTLANLAGCSVAFAETLADVDSAEAYRLYAAIFGRRVLPRR